MIGGGTIRLTSSGSRGGIGETATVNVVACQMRMRMRMIIFMQKNIHLGNFSFDPGGIGNHDHAGGLLLALDQVAHHRHQHRLELVPHEAVDQEVGGRVQDQQPVHEAGRD